MMLLASDIEVAQNVGFGIIATIMVLGALNVVRSSNVVHAALSLVAVMAGAAAQYLLLSAEFVAVTQVLVYIGAVMVLFLFGVMLTRAKLGKDVDLNNDKGWAVGAPVALLLLGVMSYVLIKGFEDDKIVVSGKGNASAAANRALSDAIFSSYAFCIGVYGVIARKNAVLVLMSIELILNSVNINLLAFDQLNGTNDGAVFALYIIAIAAAEVGVGLAMVLLIFRNRKTIALDDLSEMKG